MMCIEDFKYSGKPWERGRREVAYDVLFVYAVPSAWKTLETILTSFLS